jgi:hypothetical protein
MTCYPAPLRYLLPANNMVVTGANNTVSWLQAAFAR